VEPPYDWESFPDGTALAWATPPLAADVTVAGPGSVDLWLRSSAADTDLQVTLTEIRPDGLETYVQSGWLRASERKLDPARITLLAPQPTFRRSDAAPLAKGRFTLVTVPLYYEGHAYRKGSRIRVIISAPNGDQPIWSFRNTVPGRRPGHRARQMPSRLILPLVPGVSVPTGLPPCPGLRGEPCRSYVPTPGVS
jgi:predicted acyl esterase